MKNKTRTENSIMNSFYAFFAKIISILMLFIVRTVFIKTLNSEYLGINGLFTNIISILSLADLGIGIAIPYTLYKPLADNDTKKINIFMNFYSKIYTVIGFIVLIVGIAITPFLSLFIKEMPNIPNLEFIYILFIINSAMSYFFIYKKLLLDADQKGYIANKIIMIFTFFFSVVQILILIITKNYILYLILGILSTITQNIAISLKCDKMYTYLDKKNKEKIKKEDIKELTNNISALCIYRIGAVIMSGTDSIIISKMIGIVAVGIYSNYLLIVNSINNLLSQVFSAITASVGNLVVTENSDKSENILKQLQFFNFWIYSIVGICISILINPFINIWVGNGYLFDSAIAIAVGINFYIFGMQNIVSMYRNAYGLFQQGKFRPLIMIIVNIVLSIVFAKYMGVFGIILATILSRLIIVGIFDPYVVYKYGFNKNCLSYFKTYYKYFSVFMLLLVICNLICSNISINNILAWIIVGLISVVLLNIIYILIFRKNENYLFLKDRINYFVRLKSEKR